MAAASSFDLFSIPASPRVKYIMETSCPCTANFASVPPQPLSGSSGCPPTQTILNFSVSAKTDGSVAEASESNPAALKDFFTKLRLDDDILLKIVEPNLRITAGLPNT